jgi:hypothetical protein
MWQKKLIHEPLGITQTVSEGVCLGGGREYNGLYMLCVNTILSTSSPSTDTVYE